MTRPTRLSPLDSRSAQRPAPQPLPLRQPPAVPTAPLAAFLFAAALSVDLCRADVPTSPAGVGEASLTLAQRQRLPRDPRRERLLSQALELCKASRFDDAADAIDELLSQPDDCFVARPAPTVAPSEATAALPHAIGIRAVIAELLASSRPLREAMRLRRSAPEAAQAGIARAERFLAAGLCERAADECDSIAALTELTPSERTRLRRLRTVAANRLDRPIARTASVVLASHQERPSSTAARTAAGGSQIVPWPRWRVSLGDSLDPDIVAEWEQERLSAQTSLAGPQNSVVVGDAVATATGDAIVAHDLDTGQQRWTLPRERGRTSATLRSRVRQFEAETIQDAATTRLAAAAGRLFVVDVRPAEPRPRWILKAYDLSTPNPTLAWERAFDGPLHGPPLATADGLFVCETRGTELRVVGLSHDGETRFAQPIAVEEERLEPSLPRGGFGIEPVAAGGLVIVPTRMGLTVALSAYDGAIRWSYFDASCMPAEPDRPLPAIRRSKGNPAYPTPAIVSRGRLILLPSESDSIHCLDPQTGRCLWRVPRQTATCLIGVAGDRILLTGQRSAAAADLFTGQRVWERRIATPSGRGLCDAAVSGCVTIPQPDGLLLRLRIADGEPLSSTRERHAVPITELAASACERRPGNLLRIPGGIVWRSATHLSRHESAAAALARLDASHSDDRPSDSLAQARLAFLTGDLSRTERMLAASPRPDLKPEWEHLRRECLFAKLRETDTPDADSIAALERLVVTSEQSSRLLLHRLRSCLARERTAEAVVVADELAARDSQTRLRSGRLIQSAATAAAELVESSTIDPIAFAKQVRRVLDADRDERSRFLAVFGPHPMSRDVAREQHGEPSEERRDDAAARLQARELGLLTLTGRGPTSLRAEAIADLARLYTRCGLPREAARCWLRLTERFPDAALAIDSDLPDPARLPAAVREEIARYRPFGGTLSSPRIVVHETADTDWSDWYRRDRGKVRLGDAHGFDVVDHEAEGLASLTLIDRTVPKQIATVSTPLHYWHPPQSRHQLAGHAMPLGCTQPVCVSLIEHRVLWTGEGLCDDRGRPIFDSGRRPKVLYAGPRLTVFQDREKLVAVRTADGSLAWARDDLDRRSGLQANETAGVAADAETLILFDPDGVGYTTYSTAYGRRLGRGRLEPAGRDVRRPPLQAMRRLFYFAKVEGEWRYRIRDLAAPHAPLLLDEPTRRRSHFDRIDEERIGMIDAVGRLVVFNLATGEEELRTDTPHDWEELSSLTLVPTPTQYLVAGHPMSSPGSAAHPLGTSDIRLGHRTIEGEVAALDRESGQHQWTRRIDRGTLIETTETGLPVLLVARRLRSPRTAVQNRLSLDVIDRATGETVAASDELPRSTILRWDYDPEGCTVTLDCEAASVEVTLSGPVHVATER